MTFLSRDISSTNILFANQIYKLKNPNTKPYTIHTHQNTPRFKPEDTHTHTP